MPKLQIRHFNKLVFNKLNFHVTSLENSPTLAGLLTKLVNRNIQLSSVYDVGAFKGFWSKEVKKFYPDSKFFLFEPNSIHNDSIIMNGFKPLNYLLGKASGEQVTFYSKGQTGDSYFLEKNTEYLGSERKLVTSSLLDLISEHDLDWPDFIKIDTQGSELDILKGLGQAIHEVKVILVELPVTSLNIGAPTLSDVCSFLEEQNFVPIHLTEIHNVIDILIQVDIAFMRRDLFQETFGHDDISHREVIPNL